MRAWVVGMGMGMGVGVGLWARMKLNLSRIRTRMRTSINGMATSQLRWDWRRGRNSCGSGCGRACSFTSACFCA